MKNYSHGIHKLNQFFSLQQACKECFQTNLHKKPHETIAQKLGQ